MGRNGKPLAIRIGRRVRRIRTENSIPIRRLADRLGCSEQQVRRLEGGSHNPTLRTVYRFARALDVPVTDLLPKREDE